MSNRLARVGMFRYRVTHLSQTLERCYMWSMTAKTSRMSSVSRTSSRVPGRFSVRGSEASVPRVLNGRSYRDCTVSTWVYTAQEADQIDLADSRPALRGDPLSQYWAMDEPAERGEETSQRASSSDSDFLSNILEPGSSLNPTFLLAVDGVLALLSVTLGSLVIITGGNVHVIAMLVIALALWASIRW